MNIGFAAKTCFLLFFAVCLAGCSDTPFSTKEPVVLTLWQVYGGQTNSPMNDLVEHFNQTVGRQEGITVNVTSISNSTDIHFALVAAAKKLPGAAELPDMFTTYPKTVLAIDRNLLLDWNDWLDSEELDTFDPSFIEEGTVDGLLALLPIAKSSSALFINATIFDQFAQETGVTYEDIATMEGMFAVAKKYYHWSGGKAFFKYDDWMHYGMVNTASLGEEFFQNEAINFQSAAFAAIWKKLAIAAISGEASLLGGYATTGMMTGEVLCGIESTASALYFKDQVTFPDNTTIPLRLKVLPVPYFKDGKRLAIQRGGGLGVIRSTKDKERAAVIFGKWLTEPENNVPFVVKTGYFPVKKAAYKNFLASDSDVFPGDKYREVYEAVLEIHNNYEFYIPPFFTAFGDIEKRYCDAQMAIFKKYRGQVEQDILYSEAFLQEIFQELEEAINK